MKKIYKKPEIKKIHLDNSISLVMMTTIPDNPPPRGGGKGSGPEGTGVAGTINTGSGGGGAAGGGAGPSGAGGSGIVIIRYKFQ